MNNKIPYVSADINKDAFNCPVCYTYSKQLIYDLAWPEYNGYATLADFKMSVCLKCREKIIWYKEKIIVPKDISVTSVEPPNDDLFQEIKDDYIEAVSIVDKSPRGAAALLRLALQKLMVQLGESGKNINDDIKNLVKKGLSPQIQQSLDILRVIGNEAVHPGELDLKDDVETARQLFYVINIIAEIMISNPKRISELYSKLPASKLEYINTRDGK